MTLETTETHVLIGDPELAFTIRAWYCTPADGWFWTAIAEDHDELISGKRVSCTAHFATERAVAALTRRFA